MSWQKWTLVAIYAVSLLANVKAIGKSREPITPNLVVQLMVVTAGMVALVVTA